MMCQEKAVRVLMLAGNLIVREQAGQLLHKVDDLLVPRYVGHGEAAGRALAAVGHPLQREDKAEESPLEPRPGGEIPPATASTVHTSTYERRQRQQLSRSTVEDLSCPKTGAVKTLTRSVAQPRQ